MAEIMDMGITKIVVNVNKVSTLKQYGDNMLDQIVERISELDNIDTYEATTRAIKTDKRYQAIFSLLHECGPLAEVDYSKTISKDKNKAINLYKAEIDRLAKRGD